MDDNNHHEEKEWFVRRKKSVIILHSGGLDSTVCLLQAKEMGYDPISLGINYNQKHIIESQYAYAQCKALEVERKMIQVGWDKAVRHIPVGRTIDQIKDGVSVAFLEGRNIVFLSLACAEAAGVGATEVWLGINAIDYSGYPDCRPEFIEAFEKMLVQGFPNGPKIVNPLLNMTKPDIAQEAFRLGIRKGDTWSCYRPKVSIRGVEPCGECDACVLHDYAWAEVDASKESNAPVFESLSFR